MSSINELIELATRIKAKELEKQRIEQEISLLKEHFREAWVSTVKALLHDKSLHHSAPETVKELEKLIHTMEKALHHLKSAHEKEREKAEELFKESVKELIALANKNPVVQAKLGPLLAYKELLF